MELSPELVALEARRQRYAKHTTARPLPPSQRPAATTARLHGALHSLLHVPAQVYQEGPRANGSGGDASLLFREWDSQLGAIALNASLRERWQASAAEGERAALALRPTQADGSVLRAPSVLGDVSMFMRTDARAGQPRTGVRAWPRAAAREDAARRPELRALVESGTAAAAALRGATNRRAGQLAAMVPAHAVHEQSRRYDPPSALGNIWGNSELSGRVGGLRPGRAFDNIFVEAMGTAGRLGSSDGRAAVGRLDRIRAGGAGRSSRDPMPALPRQAAARRGGGAGSSGAAQAYDDRSAFLLIAPNASVAGRLCD